MSSSPKEVLCFSSQTLMFYTALFMFIFLFFAVTVSFHFPSFFFKVHVLLFGFALHFAPPSLSYTPSSVFFIPSSNPVSLQSLLTHQHAWLVAALFWGLSGVVMDPQTPSPPNTANTSAIYFWIDPHPYSHPHRRGRKKVM